MNVISDLPEKWAEADARTESEAFENALKRITPEQTIKALVEENASLREQIRRLSDDNFKLRQALTRSCEEEWD